MKQFAGTNFSDDEYAALFGSSRKGVHATTPPSPEPCVADALSDSCTAGLMQAVAYVMRQYVGEQVAAHKPALDPEELANEIGPPIADAIAKAVDPLLDQLAAVQERADTLEAANAELRAQIAAQPTPRSDVQNEMADLLAEIAESRQSLITNSIEPIKDDLLAELRKETPTWRGVWQSDELYPPGSIVAHKGAAWIARSQTSERPGDGETKWQLAIKAARNGRDGLSAFELAQKHGFAHTSSEREWLESLRANNVPSGTAQPRR
jgi:hypothetical protein